MAGLVVTTEPTAEPVSLQEVKDYMRIEDSTDERVLRPFIRTARRLAEEHLGRALMPQTLTLPIDAYDDIHFTGYAEAFENPKCIDNLKLPVLKKNLKYYKNFIILPKPPVTSVTSVSTFNDSDTETTFAASKYYVDTAREPARIVLRQGETFPTALRVANAIKIVYVTGYTNAFAVPEPIRMGILQHIAFLYEHRGDMYEPSSPLPPALRSLYSPYVVFQGLSNNTLMGGGKNMFASG